jgi:asparagine synthase (glutamine-hydrolysing)
MCGIAGIVGFATRETLVEMTRSLTHRGPDDEGVWQDEAKGVHFGHRRLTILDPSGGPQPMVSEDLVLVYNGEVYNHLELREELEAEGAVFRTRNSDTETVLLAYRHWGPECVLRFNGMWALCIYDRREGRLFFSRDRFGQKPIYYARTKDGLAFASELSALLLHPQLADAPLSRRGLTKFFAFDYIPAPDTLYEGIHKLPAGHNMVFNLDDRSLRLRRYWDYQIEPEPIASPAAFEELCEDLKQRLSDAVQRCLLSDVGVGVLLSGGLDSTALAALAAEHQGGRVDTFSVGFAEPSFDESSHARAAADWLRSNHSSENLSFAQAKELAPEVLSRLAEPLGDASLLPTYQVCKLARAKVTVVLGGDGADELFAGYDPFRALRASELYSRFFPAPLHSAMRGAARHLPDSHANLTFKFKVTRWLRGLEYEKPYWVPSWMACLDVEELNEFLGVSTTLEEVYGEVRALWDACGADNLVDQATHFYVRFYLQNDILTKMDRAGMMNSLEVRAPYLDNELVDLVRKIPAEWRLRGGSTKYPLKRALRGLLPDSVIDRKKKGFGLPIGQWLKDGFLDGYEFSHAAPVSTEFVMRRLEAHRKGRENHRAFLWNYLALDRALRSRG